MTTQATATLPVSPEFPAIVFVNASAGRGRAITVIPQIRRLFAARKFPAEFILTANTSELESRAHKEIAAGRRVLLAMGGDGTFQGLANAAFGSDVVLGVLPTGGGNDFASALGIPRDSISAAHALLNGRPRRVDLLRACTADGRTRLYVGGGGIGLDAEAARHAGTTYARVPGRLRYIAAAIHALCGFKPLSVRAEFFPGSNLPSFEARVLLTAVLNTPSYGAGVRLAQEARVDDGLLTAVFVTNLTALQVVAVVPRLLTRGNLPEAYLTRVAAQKIRLTTDRSCLFHGDGELLGPAPVEIEVLPNAISVLAPATP